MDIDRLTEVEFRPGTLHWQESVFTIGNGYLGTRGSFPEGYPSEQAATFIHGVYDDVPIYTTELVNTPNWIHLEISINGRPFRMDLGELQHYQRDLDLSTGILTRHVTWQSENGDRAELTFEQFASLANPHVAAIRCQVKSINFTGELEVQAGIPGYVDNVGQVHWNWLDQGRIHPKELFLSLQTRSSKVELCEACHLELIGSEEPTYEFCDSRWFPILSTRVRVKPGSTVVAEKLVCIHTNRDSKDTVEAAQKGLEAAAKKGYTRLRAEHVAAWAREWENCQINIEGDEEADRAMRYNLFQLLIAAPRHDDRVSIAARALSGFGSRGHIFWDAETYILPFFTFTQPEIARNMLMYRYHNLPGARRKAAKRGYEGAMYPWESAINGDEVTPTWLPAGEDRIPVRIWTQDLEHHIVADVAYGTYQYWRATRDDAFMRDFGSEIILETARFWGSRADWDATRSRYLIGNVMGPDEYHDHVNNNAYTNGMARWNLTVALETKDWMESAHPHKAEGLIERIDLRGEETEHWREVINHLDVIYEPSNRLYEQFEGFFDRQDIKLSDYEPRAISMQSLLGTEDVQKYQVIRHPDVLMMLYLLRHLYDSKTLEANWDYYTPRTDLTFGSALGPAIQAAIAAYLGKTEDAYRHFMRVALLDLQDLYGNTFNGIHAAAAGGLWQAAVFGFGGLQIRPEGPSVRPNLPQAWKSLAFRVKVRGKAYDFDLRPSGTSVSGSRARHPSSGPRFPIRGAIFNLEGVLTDTSEQHYLAWQQLADESDISFDRDRFEFLRKMPTRDALLFLMDGRPESDLKIKEMIDQKNTYYLDNLEELTPKDVLPGALRFLEEVHTGGLRVAIGSTGANSRVILERVGLLDFVEAFADDTTVSRNIPAPDIFLHAAGQLGVPAEQCMVFENSESGIEAARAGGLWAIGVGPDEQVKNAHIALPALEKVSWKNLLAQLQQANNNRPGERQANSSASHKE